MLRLARPLAAAVLLALIACGDDPHPDRIFAAIEAESAIAVLDAATGEVVARIELADGHDSDVQRFKIHNVQGSPDGRMVWATAAAMAVDGEHGGHGHGEEQLIGVDAAELTVEARIELGTGKHLAHVVIGDGVAFVTANEADEVLVVDLDEEALVRSIPLPDATGPHGLRLTPDGKTLVIAGMGQGALVLVDVASGEVTTHPLPGRAVQTAVLPGGAVVYATIFDTRQLARLALGTGELRLIDMPEGSAGPLQLYPTPDGRHVWIADQGLLDGRPAGTQLLRFDVALELFDLVAPVSPAPHGVVVTHDGKHVWTTTLVEGKVEKIDASTGEVVASSQVGRMPNGISCVQADGSMP